jgi:LuxR family maltose regulon positive regulatory protein
LFQAVQFGSTQGFLRTFIDAGEGLQPLLQELALRGISLEYVRKILSASEVQPGPRPSAQAALIEPLSDREIEVLRLVATGFSNREIAAKLFLSLGTVKSHIHNIYGKLDARNRTQAVSRARELELL